LSFREGSAWGTAGYGLILTRAGAIGRAFSYSADEDSGNRRARLFIAEVRRFAAPAEATLCIPQIAGWEFFPDRDVGQLRIGQRKRSTQKRHAPHRSSAWHPHQ
jgi:hypothetical protein